MWKTELQAIIDQHLLRELSVIDSPASPIVDREGQKTLLMASNNYLGLADHPSLKHAAQAAIQKFGVGAGASRLLSGSQTPHHDLELALAQFTGTEAALTFSSGYGEITAMHTPVRIAVPVVGLHHRSFRRISVLACP